MSNLLHENKLKIVLLLMIPSWRSEVLFPRNVLSSMSFPYETWSITPSKILRSIPNSDRKNVNCFNNFGCFIGNCQFRIPLDADWTLPGWVELSWPRKWKDNILTPFTSETIINSWIANAILKQIIIRNETHWVASNFMVMYRFLFLLLLLFSERNI